MSCVLSVDDFGQKEVPEHSGLGKGHAFRDWWAKGGNVLGTGDSNTAEEKEKKKF